LNYRRRIGEARRLDDNAVDRSTARDQVIDGARQISAHSAADASVVQFKDVLPNIDYELAIDADLTKLVDAAASTGPSLPSPSSVGNRSYRSE
jgi:hypothetical protein